MNYKQKIESNLDYIVQHTSNVSRLLLLLLEQRIIDTSEKIKLESIERHDERLHALFSNIAKRGSVVEFEIYQLLRRTGNSHVADKILGKSTLKSIKSVAALQVYADYKNKNSSKVPVRRTFFITQEGEADYYEKFENVSTEIGNDLEVLSLKYVVASPKHLLKAFELCENLNVIKLHNVTITGPFLKKAELKSLMEFSYIDDLDRDKVQEMSIDERLQFLQQLLFFVPKNMLLQMELLQIKITVCISNHYYVQISDYDNKNPFQIFSSRRESISVIEEAFADIEIDDDGIFDY